MREFLGGLVVRTQHCHCRGTGSNPDRGTEILQDVWHGQNIFLKLKQKRAEINF